MIEPKYTLEKIKFATDNPTYKKACELYESGKIMNFDDNGFTYTAKVKGTEVYNVVVDSKYFDRGNCNCYLGKNDTLCKHMVAVAIYALLRGKKIPAEDKDITTKPVCSNNIGELSKEEFAGVQAEISASIKYIKAYSGPSKTWFAYQDSLSEGTRRLSATVSKLPVSLQTTELLISLLLRLDKKLISGGVDDSDGIVGGFIQEVVEVLVEFAKRDSETIKAIKKLLGIETCFGWEEPLIRLYDESFTNL
jgi:hypothetical protein